MSNCVSLRITTARNRHVVDQPNIYQVMTVTANDLIYLNIGLNAQTAAHWQRSHATREQYNGPLKYGGKVVYQLFSRLQQHTDSDHKSQQRWKNQKQNTKMKMTCMKNDDDSHMQ